MPDGSVVLIGGFGNEANNVWRFMPAGSTAQNSSHTYTLPGNYSVVLQAYSYNGCNSTLKTGYITVRGLVPPEADFTGIPVNGTAPLLVQFNDTSTVTGITAYTWIFSDDPGSVYTTQNLSHTFNTTGTYDVSHSVTNSTGTTFWKNVTSYITVESSGTVAPAKIGLFRGGFWILDYNGNYQWSDVGTGNDLVAGFGMAGDKPVIGNWNHTIPGDKIGVFRNGTWLMDYNGNFQWDGVDKSAYLGQAGDIPVIGDWNNNGDKKIGVFRNGFWMLDGNGNYTWDGTGTGLDVVAGFGQTGDIPVVGDWNGNHQDKIGLFRNGFWILDYNGNYVWNGPGTGNDLVAGFGAAGDIPIVKDWDGDGISEIAVFRPSAGQWLIDYNGNYLWDGEGAGQDVSMYLGQNGDVAIAGDWNSNGNDKLGVFRDGFWIIDTDGDFIWDGPPDDKVAGFGQAGDIPVPGKYV
jgi:PKD repeat protein